jgi:hypothetical protein
MTPGTRDTDVNHNEPLRNPTIAAHSTGFIGYWP